MIPPTHYKHHLQWGDREVATPSRPRNQRAAALVVQACARATRGDARRREDSDNPDNTSTGEWIILYIYINGIETIDHYLTSLA